MTSGVVTVFCHQSISFNTVLTEHRERVELIVINVSKFNLKIGIVYKNPKAPSSYFIELMDSLLSANKRMILIGDMNIDLLHKTAPN